MGLGQGRDGTRHCTPGMEARAPEVTSVLPEAAAAGVPDGRGEGLLSLSGRRLGGRRRPVPAPAKWPCRELPGGQNIGNNAV